MNFQKHTDKLLAHTFLPLIPNWVTPNQLSWVRIFSLPFIFYFLIRENYLLSLILFSLSAFTDALDGSLARIKDRVTEYGKKIDPLADKALIITVAVVLVPQFFGWALFAALIILEILNASFAWQTQKRLGFNPGANWAGKIKMILQSFSLIAIFISALTFSNLWLQIALIFFLAGLTFTLVQAFAYTKLQPTSSTE